MSIRMDQIKRFDHMVENDYLDASDDAVLMDDAQVLSMIRAIFRDRSDIKIIPVVLASAREPQVNKYGHDMFIEIRYSDRGYRAVYAGKRSGSGVTGVTCYMD